MAQEPVLSVRGLTVAFDGPEGRFEPVRDLSFEIAPGEILGVVGESGAGKSMTGAAILRLIEPPGRISAGEVRLRGRRIDDLPEAEFARLRGKRIGMVFQDPLTSLDPLQTIGRQLIETLRTHLPLDAAAARRRAVELLEETGVERAAERLSAYPHEFSGGMRQRVVIALALAAEPELLIADEPTSALDVSIQAQIIRLLKALCARRGTAVLLVTHDMGVVAEAADRMLVMEKGRLAESGPVGEAIRRPKSDYARRLIAAIPSLSAPSGRPKPSGPEEAFVALRHVSRSFPAPGGGFPRLFGRARPEVAAVSDVSFEIGRGRTFGLVGESGSGKSTLARILTGLTPPDSGEVRVGGREVWEDRRRARRGEVQMIFQDPYASLNPRWKVGEIVAEPLRLLGLAQGASEIEDRVAALLARVRLEPEAMRRHPHEFSGGQRQRIAIARALSSRPALIVCDEPTSALDVSVQAQVLDLMREVQEEDGLTYLLISHNLAVVRQMADHVGVLRHGRLVEAGEAEAVFSNPQTDYARMLLASVPDVSRAA